MIPGSERRPRRVERGTPPEAAASAPFPIVEQIRVCLGADARERAARTAAEMLESEPRLADIAAFGEGVCSGLDGGASLFIEDHSALRLFERLGNLAYTYRALLMARPGDLVAIGLSRSPGFERYCADTLGLGEAEIVEPAPGAPTDSLTARCTRDAAAIERLARHARRHGGLNIVPYMGTGGVWALAGMIAERSGSPVRVAAPPPRLVRRVNDKIWFSGCVDRLIGAQATPVGESAAGSAMLTAKVAAFARSHASVAIKLPDSASSKGNLVFDAASLRGRPLPRLRRHLDESMRRAGWRDEYPVLVSAWEQPVLASPSVHLWIPLTGSGDVIVEAVFDQQVVGAGGEFAGAAPSTLPSAWQRRLASEAALIGLLFQRLGYFGRCSFDAIVVGSDAEHAVLHWIECNGRWGGVSIPMTLASRLFGDWRRQPFVIIEQSDLCVPPRTFADAVARLGDDLYVAGGEPKGAVILSPWQLEQGSGYELMVFDADVERAGARARRIAQSIRDWR